MRIIFLHGFPDNPEVWRYTVEHLQGRFTCRTPELHSLKFEEQVQRLQDMSEGEQLVLVGHDIGGALATEFAARYPQKVARVILVNSIGLTMFAHRLRMLEQLLRSSYMSVFLNPFVNRFTLAPVSKLLLKLIYDLGKLPSDDRLRLNGPEVLDGLARFKELAWMIPKKMFDPDEALIVPVNVILCDNDPVHMKPSIEELKRFFRHPELHALAGGHWPMRTEREAFHRLLDRLLSEIKE